MPNVGGFAGDAFTRNYITKHENTAELLVSEDGTWDCRNSKDKNVLGNTLWVARPKMIFSKG